MCLAVTGLTKKEATKPAIGKQENGIDIAESALKEQINNDNLIYVDGAHQNNQNNNMSALELEEDIESPWHLDSFSTSLPKKYFKHLSKAADKRGKNIPNEQAEDVFYTPSCMSGSRNFKMAKLEDTRM